MAVLAEEVARAVERVDAEALRKAYREQNEFVYVERWLPASLVERLVADVDRVRPTIHRNYIPRHKKGGSVSYFTLVEQAPTIIALYRSPAFLRLLSEITGARVQQCPAADPHSCALYFYTEPGDHIGFHYDTSYYRSARYTVLVGLIERSSSRLVCQLYRDVSGRTPVEVSLRTDPGTLIVFNGDKLWHAITPLGEGEERVSLTMEFVTDPRMTPLKRFVSNMKDSIAYFGFRSVFGGRVARPTTPPG
ncbi:MAG: 2OG-Fe(II) oxygenase [Candidatus Rokubacteria bacterium RIFCSPLOWO2_12_FULL_71_22]|nr:MAG: 2OG-Fe(II) oxygenase [Candidatus Rokubacteria bacterium RIFCSPLOWO2_12_FULL_71_22]